MKKILVTGCAGFIGYHLAKELIESGQFHVIGIDSIDDYYDQNLKLDRLKSLEQLKNKNNFSFYKGNLADKKFVVDLFKKHTFNKTVNLAAQAGVRHSIENPHKYIESNIVGFTNLIEAIRYQGTEHFVYASTSSVYGASNQMPFSEDDPISHPLQFYAVTKRSNELMAHSYANLFSIPSSGMRFFTVYGPWGRPDMALFLFTKNIIEGKKINIFNQGKHYRDFTYVDDIISGIKIILDNPPTSNQGWDYLNGGPGSSYSPYEIYNIGNGDEISLLDFVKEIEECLGSKAKIELLPIQPGDVEGTLSNTNKLRNLGYKPLISYKEGIKNFIRWYKDYYNVN